MPVVTIQHALRALNRSRINALSEVLDTIATHGSLAEPHIIVKRGQRASPL
jgi:hypothetical protein